MNAASAARTASTPSVPAVPPPLTDQQLLERDTAAGIALKVTEPVDEVLALTY